MFALVSSHRHSNRRSSYRHPFYTNKKKTKATKHTLKSKGSDIINIFKIIILYKNNYSMFL